MKFLENQMKSFSVFSRETLRGFFKINVIYENKEKTTIITYAITFKGNPKECYREPAELGQIDAP